MAYEPGGNLFQSTKGEETQEWGPVPGERWRTLLAIKGTGGRLVLNSWEQVTVRPQDDRICVLGTRSQRTVNP